MKQFGKPVIASIAGLCEDDFPVIAQAINEAGPDLIEVNLSCPNIPESHKSATMRMLQNVHETGATVITVPMGVKLPPYFDPAHHQLMGEVIGRCGVDFFNLINSVGTASCVNPNE